MTSMESGRVSTTNSTVRKCIYLIGFTKKVLKIDAHKFTLEFAVEKDAACDARS